MKTSPLAGLPPQPGSLVNIAKLVTAYYCEIPDADVASERVVFGTSGHRGSSLARSFNEWHVLAISQAVCDYRAQHRIDGPLFLGMDTHALSEPALTSVLEVLAANQVHVMLSEGDQYTPTPAISHAIIGFNRARTAGFADGIVITPSHNPPNDGGIKYNPPHGGAAEGVITGWIQTRANALLKAGLAGVKRMTRQQAMAAPTTHWHDYLSAYVGDLGRVIDMEVLSGSKVKLGVDPLGGAGVHYWSAIAERYRLDLTVVNDAVDPTFRFMSLDWDGQIRMDPSSPHAMQRLIGLKERFDVAFACDTDHDRHGIVTRSAGLMPANHYLCAAVSYLLQHRPGWREAAAIGTTVVTSRMIGRVAQRLGRTLYEVPVGFKWYAKGLLDGSLAFAGEESAGATFACRDGSAWTTDKDGIVAALLSGEMTARTGRDPAEAYRELAQLLGESFFERVDAKATRAEKLVLQDLSPGQVPSAELAGEAILDVLTKAPGNSEPIGGLKVVSKNAWFAARPSGTEDIYKIYAESFRGEAHLQRVVEGAQTIVNDALRASRDGAGSEHTAHSARAGGRRESP